MLYKSESLQEQHSENELLDSGISFHISCFLACMSDGG